MRKVQLFIPLVALVLFVIGCKKEGVSPEPDPNPVEEPELKLTVNDQNFSIDENSESNTVVGNVAFSFNGQASDLTFEFENAASDFPYEIDKATGSVSFIGDMHLDHENPAIPKEYIVNIKVDHKTDITISKTIKATITLNDIDERPTKNLKAYYPMDGNTEDMSGNNAHGVMKDSVVSIANRFGEDDKAYKVVYGGILIDSVGYFNDMEKFTIGSWVQVNTEMNGSGSLRYLMTKFGSGRDFGIGYDGKGRINFHLYNGGYIHCYSPFEILEEGEWVHLIFTYENHTLKIYLNGEKVGEKDTGGRAPIWTSNYFYLSGEDTHLDEVRIYDTVFTQDEIDIWYIEETVND